jgi:hypothetical protein
MDESEKIVCLRKTNKRLLKAYFIHVGWLASTCAFAATDGADLSITATLWMVLITVPPVLLYAVSVHKACRAIDPKAPTFGWLPILAATVLLTPFESALVLPARNLIVARRLLRNWDAAVARKADHPP